MENFVQNLVNMKPEQVQAFIKEMALYGPAPGQQMQPQVQQQAPVAAPQQAQPQSFATILPPQQAAPAPASIPLPVTTNGVSSQQAPLDKILGGQNGY